MVEGEEILGEGDIVVTVSLGYNSSYVVSSSGHSGGLCVFWKNEIEL